jgi:hypothetical protein
MYPIAHILTQINRKLALRMKKLMKLFAGIIFGRQIILLKNL